MWKGGGEGGLRGEQGGRRKRVHVEEEAKNGKMEWESKNALKEGKEEDRNGGKERWWEEGEWVERRNVQREEEGRYG